MFRVDLGVSLESGFHSMWVDDLFTLIASADLQRSWWLFHVGKEARLLFVPPLGIVLGVYYSKASVLGVSLSVTAGVLVSNFCQTYDAPWKGDCDTVKVVAANLLPETVPLPSSIYKMLPDCRHIVWSDIVGEPHILARVQY